MDEENSIEEFERSVSEFLSAFAEIEYQVTLVLSLASLPKDQREWASNIGAITVRCRIAQIALNGTDIEGAEQLTELLDRVIELAKFRNKLVHNPRHVKVVQDPGTGEVEEKVGITSSRNQTDISGLAEVLPEKLLEAQEVVQGFSKHTVEADIVFR